MKSNDDPFGDFFGGTGAVASKPTSTNPWNDSRSAADPFAPAVVSEFDLKSPPLSSITTTTTTIGGGGVSAAKSMINPTRKTPESFLGENSSLVNLENLIPSQIRPKSTNPFGSAAVTTTTSSMGNGSGAMTTGMTTSSSHGQLNNPFAVQQAQQALNRPTINQLQQQSMFPSFGQAPATVAAAPTLLQPSLTGGGLGKLSFIL